MTKKTVLILIISLLQSSGLLAREIQITTEELQIELELVWVNEFTDPIIDYIVDIDDTPKLRVVALSSGEINKGGLQFRTNEGKISEQISLDSLTGWGILISENGNYISTVQGSNIDRNDNVTFTIYDKNGDVLWKQNNLNARPVRLLPNENYLSAEGYMSWHLVTLRYRDEIIDTLKIIPLQDNADVTSTGALDISSNDFIVWNVYDIDHNVGYLALYEGKSGNEVWRKEFSDWITAGNVCISYNGEIICARGILDNTLFIYSKDGRQLWQKSIGGGYLQEFSKNTSVLVANGPSNRIINFNASTGDSIWAYCTDDNRSFFAIAVSCDGEFVAAIDGAGNYELPGGESINIFLFDKTGIIVWQERLEIQKGNSPYVRFSDDGKHLLICNGNQLYCYRIIGGGK